jgi:hypothetical protein
VAVLLLDHVDAGAHQVGQQPAVVGVEQEPRGEGVAKRVWAARLDARGLERGVPVAVSPVAEIEVAAAQSLALVL